MKNSNSKKIVKVIGNMLSIVAIIFVFKRVCNSDFDVAVIYENIILLLILAFAYGIHIFMLGFSWKWILGRIFNIEATYDKIASVFCKANIMKYIPGNIFQYIGRNQLAIDNDCSHKLVATSTIIDVICNVVGVVIISLLLFRNDISYLLKYLIDIMNVRMFLAIAFFLFLIIIAAFAFVIKRKERLQSLGINITKKSFLAVLMSVVHYCFWAIYSSAIYVIIVVFIEDTRVRFEEALTIGGAYLLSWLSGFLLPGAPGGIGIREAALAILVSPMGDSLPFINAIVIYRIVNILGDFIGLGLSVVFRKIKGRSTVL